MSGWYHGLQGRVPSDLPVGVAVLAGRCAVGGPAGVRDTSVRLKGFGHVGLVLGDELLQLGDLAHFLERADFILPVAVHSHTGRVIATVLQS